MAFRIQDRVVRGEIDNRVKGIVRGNLWVAGRVEPVRLELKGNAWPDLAGWRLTFTNRLKPVSDARLESLHGLQRGSIGDLTASRKARVFDVPMAEARAMHARREKPPEHLANCLHLEWFSERNGPGWAEAGMADFMQRLNEAVESHQHGQKDPEEAWDEHDYERYFRECDARTEKYGELFEARPGAFAPGPGRAGGGRGETPFGAGGGGGSTPGTV